MIFLLILLNSCTPNNYNIHTIEHRALGYYGNCPIFSLKINEEKSAVYVSQISDLSSIHYDDTYGAYKAHINDKDFNQLISLLNNTNFPSLKDKFKVLSTDSPACILKVTYGNNLEKTIFDDGQAGTLNLKKYTNSFLFCGKIKNGND